MKIPKNINFDEYDFLILETIFTGHHISLYLNHVIKIFNQKDYKYLICVTSAVYNSNEFKSLNIKNNNVQIV